MAFLKTSVFFTKSGISTGQQASLSFSQVSPQCLARGLLQGDHLINIYWISKRRELQTLLLSDIHKNCKGDIKRWHSKERGRQAGGKKTRTPGGMEHAGVLQLKKKVLERS